jgi:hypothetical protein
VILKKKTVFVLGAGASAPYGYPIGKVLRDKIIELGGDGRLHAAFTSSTDFINLETGIDKDLSPDFSDRFSKTNPFFNLAETFTRSAQLTIDEFLRTHKSITDLGKFMIAYVLLSSESVRSLMTVSWCQLIWDRLVRGKNSPEEVSPNIAFVTFNYDTSLEYIFSEAIKHTFMNADNKDVSSFFSSVPIFHIHGKIKIFPWENRGRGNFERIGLSSFSNKEMVEMSKGITLFHEAGEENVENMAKQIIEVAENVVFLGFGFDPINVSKLNQFRPQWVPAMVTGGHFTSRPSLSSTGEVGSMVNISSFTGKKLFATGINMSEARKHEIKKTRGLEALQFVQYESINDFLDAHIDQFV